MGEEKPDTAHALDAVAPGAFQDWADLAPWTVFGSDLVVIIDHVLTEPTCPTARIEFEMPDRAGLKSVATGIGDTIEEAIAVAVERARARLPELAEARRQERAARAAKQDSKEASLGADRP